MIRKPSIGSFFAVAIKEIRVSMRYPVNFIAQFISLFVFAGLFGSVWAMFGGDESFIEIALSGLIVMELLADSLWGIGFSMSWERYQGTLESFYLTPVNRFTSAVARFGVTFIWMPITMIMCFGILGAIGAEVHILAGLGVLFFIFPMLTGIGCAFAGICLLFKQTGQVLIGFVQFGAMLFCAFFYPFFSLPEPMLWISRFIPLSYGIDAFRAVLLGTPPELLGLRAEMILLAIFAVISPLLGYLIYSVAEHRVLVEGGLRVY